MDLSVNSEAATEDVGEGTGGNGKVQVDEDEYRRYGYKDPVIQLLCRSYMNIWARPKVNISGGEITRTVK